MDFPKHCKAVVLSWGRFFSPTKEYVAMSETLVVATAGPFLIEARYAAEYPTGQGIPPPPAKNCPAQYVNSGRVGC